jgi:hypothetical protein
MSQDLLSLADRIKKSRDIMEKYPGKIPIICNAYFDEMQCCKFLIHDDNDLSMLISVLRKKTKMDHTQSIFILSENNQMMNHHVPIKSLYNVHRNEDGFMYIRARKENCFGC